MQGIVIVGDINAEEMEAKLKEVFKDVKAPVNPAERIYYPVADNQEPLIYIALTKKLPILLSTSSSNKMQRRIL